MILSLPSGNVVGTSSVQRLASWARPTFMRYKVPTGGGGPTKGIPTPSKTHGNKDNILLMAEILHHLGCMKPYKNNGKNYLSTGAGFRPSTVAPANGDIHHKVEYIGPSTVHKDALFPLNAVIQTLLVQCLVVQVRCHFSLEKSICEQIYFLGIRRQEILTPKMHECPLKRDHFKILEGTFIFQPSICREYVSFQGGCNSGPLNT